MDTHKSVYDNPFLNTLLLICVCYIIFLVVTHAQMVNDNSGNVTNTGMGNLEYEMLNKKTDKFMPELPPETARHLGPVPYFHQRFRNFAGNVFELGWRNYFMRKYSNITSVDNSSEQNFCGTVVGNYLKNLENTKNIYRGEL